MPTWFDQARLGLFIHWGHCSQSGWELSWPLVGGVPVLPRCADVPAETYHRGATTFCPRRDAAREWMRHAKAIGARYAVLTTKHHDGYSMFDTKLSDHCVVRGPYGGDLVREYVSAAREAGLRVGFYYSLSDWHHPDYPAFRDEHRPYSFGFNPRPTPEQWERYRTFLFGQIEELLTGYGPVDLLWFDGGWERSPDDWRSLELREHIRRLQPDTLVNDRLPGSGDFDTPEQALPATRRERAWETCLTMNESWGYAPDDTAYKSARELVHTLCEVAGRGGNLLLNVGPRGDGSLPPEQVERLETIAGWMAGNGEAIVGTEPGLDASQFHGPTTRRGERVFLHLVMRPYESVTVRAVPIRRVRAVTVLRTGQALEFTTRCPVADSFTSDPAGELTIRVPEAVVDSLATVLAIDFAPAA